MHLCLSTALAWNVEDMMPASEKCIFNFNSEEEINKWHLYSDSEYGGATLPQSNSIFLLCQIILDIVNNFFYYIWFKNHFSLSSYVFYSFLGWKNEDKNWLDNI